MKRLILFSLTLLSLFGTSSVRAEANPYHDALDAVRMALAQARANGECRAAFESGVEEAELNRFLAWANQVPERRVVETRFGDEESSTGTVYHVLVLEQPRPNQYRLVALPLRQDRSGQLRLVQIAITPTGSLEKAQGNLAFLLLGGVRSRFDPQRSPRSGPWLIQSAPTPEPPPPPTTPSTRSTATKPARPRATTAVVSPVAEDIVLTRLDGLSSNSTFRKAVEQLLTDAKSGQWRRMSRYFDQTSSEAGRAKWRRVHYEYLKAARLEQVLITPTSLRGDNRVMTLPGPGGRRIVVSFQYKELSDVVVIWLAAHESYDESCQLEESLFPDNITSSLLP